MKSIFPATYSTLSPHALADLPAERYHLDSTHCTFPVRGVRNTYEIDSPLDQVNTLGLLTGYCHFDLLPKNMHFEGDSVTYFDFDFMGYGGWCMT
ncbi:hypothetical protein [Larkinella terrae]|uniref:Uncharacterized protein n=1 Tax=Larkinella terrae TaxID=2025311 RepID=A0A7K0EFS7_9BACT|nr:hypothetical protein [Larkinella terrae]MRS60306.1 hypothetical protein [Larkinella terrae]